MCAAPALLQLRTLTAEETTQLRALAQSRTAEARLRDRARSCRRSHEGARVMHLVAELGRDEKTVRTWSTRFNRDGIAGLADAPRSGRPPTLTAAQLSEVVAVSRQAPDRLALPFGSWTLDRLTAYLQEECQVPIHRSRVSELLRAEGLHWRHHEAWMPAVPDPEFAEKRG